VALLNALIHTIIDEGLADEEFIAIAPATTRR
jgi:anaerobic selenocysteine-containing dehydrogenase